MNIRIETTRFSLQIEEGMLAGIWLAGGVPGDPEEPGVPDLPAEPRPLRNRRWLMGCPLQAHP